MPATDGGSPAHRGRRDFLSRTILGLLAGLRARSSAAAEPAPASADHCILIFMAGGPSHLDMWDPKPNAPVEIRGEFDSIATRTPGVAVSEHLPRLAGCLDRCSLVRSVHHRVSAHAAAAGVALTGVEAGMINRPASRSDHPAFGSVIARYCSENHSLLPYVWLPHQVTEISLGRQPIPGMMAGFLGAEFDPFLVLDDPSDPDFSIPALRIPGAVSDERMRNRHALLADVDRVMPDSTYDHRRRQALELLTSADVQATFSLDDEPATLRDAYGNCEFGASLLLARRLIEAGSRVVGVSMGANLNNVWDTHIDNFSRLRGLLPRFDAGLSALLADLEDRGLLERTLVLALGEFGRSPQVDDNGGRNHWPHCYTLLMAGGGIRRGVILGASDDIGGFPAESPVTPADVLATAYCCLGLRPDGEVRLRDQLGRPVDVTPGGEPIVELLV